MDAMRSAVLALSCLALSEAGAACAQEYPYKPVRIVTSEAGGGGDFAARLIGQALAASLGKQFVVENRPSLAAEIVAKASADGYTLMIYGNTVWITPLMRKAAWDPLKDFAPITLTVRAPNVLAVNPQLPAQSVRDLVELAKAKPGALNYGSTATGSSTHLAAELFNAMAHVNITRINYKGVALAVNDIIGGRVQLMFANASSVMPHVKTGRLRALAVTSAQPTALFPGMPTVAASGVPGYESSAQFGMFAPARTPATIVARIHRATLEVLAQADVKEKFFNAGADVVGNTPAEFAAFLKSETVKWTKVIKDAGIHED